MNTPWKNRIKSMWFSPIASTSHNNLVGVSLAPKIPGSFGEGCRPLRMKCGSYRKRAKLGEAVALLRPPELKPAKVREEEEGRVEFYPAVEIFYTLAKWFRSWDQGNGQLHELNPLFFT